MTQFKRAILTGTLTTQANFHLGSGLESPQESDNDSKKPGSQNDICLDANNNPYIPASSLRGYLRQIVAESKECTQETENKLFGMARQKRGSEKEGNIGALRLYDARWKSTNYTKQQISQTSIDPVTATAKQHHLSTHAIVPPQSPFEVVIEFDSVDEEQIKTVLQALQTFSPENRGKLGKGKSTGQGELHWQQTSLKVLTEKQLKEWLTQGTVKSDPRKSGKSIIEKSLESFFRPHEIPSEIKPFASNLQQINIQLKAESPILINDPHAVERIEKEYKEQKKENSPDCVYMQRNGCAIIPGSALKGWARARCRRILFSLLDNGNETVSDAMLDELFGSTNQQSRLFFDDASVPADEAIRHKQTFNAIDRFTGGVKPHALYNVEAIWPTTPFSTQIHYPKEGLEGWMKLLLLYVIRDSMEGDLVLGWGKSKGYGRLTLCTDEHEKWGQYYQAIDQDDLAQWDREFQQKLLGEES